MAAAPTLDDATASAAAADAATIAAALAESLRPRAPAMLERRWWEDHLLAWADSDPAAASQMLRFVDALPALRTHDHIIEHLAAYHREAAARFENAEPIAPGVSRCLSEGSGLLGRVVAFNARSNVTRMARRLLGGETIDEVGETVSRLRRQGLAAGIDWLTRDTLTSSEVDAYAARQVALIDGLAPIVDAWPDDVLLDRTDCDFAARLHLTIRLSQLATRFHPVATDDTVPKILERLEPIADAARRTQTHLQFAAEPAAVDALRHHVIDWGVENGVLSDVPFGITVSAARRSAADTIAEYADWADDVGRPIGITLTEGEARESDAAEAWLAGRDAPVFTRDAATREHFRRCTDRLLERRDALRPALATHALDLVGHALAAAESQGTPDGAIEFHAALGVGEDLARVIEERGVRARVVAPCGESVTGMARLAKSLLENPAALARLRRHLRRIEGQSSTAPNGTDMPATLDAVPDLQTPEPPPAFTAPPAFAGEPLSDWSDDATAAAMAESLDYVTSLLGEEYPLIIDGKAVDGRGSIVSRNPSQKKQVVGKVASASPDQAREAVESAARAQQTWARRPMQERAEFLEVIAAEIASRRFEMASWLVVEAGRDWVQADVEVSEAIDFCRLYAREARRLDEPDRVTLVGEENETAYRPRGVAVVIASWRSPLAALAGMTAAALVTGNAVVVKPAEQTPVIAARLLALFRDAGLPPGVASFVAGETTEIGPPLVTAPQTRVVAFAGDRETGLMLSEAAAARESQAEGLKQVMVQLGGQNVIVVDEDADLDEAVAGTLDSAFLCAGQLDASCSRVVVMRKVREAFRERLAEAAGELVIGDAADPATQIGPVISEDAYDRLAKAIADAGDDVEYLLAGKPSKAAGYFVPPHIAVGIPEGHFLLHEETVGPLVTIQSGRTFDDVLSLATAGPAPLVAGLFSRNPDRIDQARRELRAGNVVINRPTVGMTVARQPFGGFGPAGLGAKSGGSDYLRQFVVPVTISERTARRGFARS